MEPLELLRRATEAMQFAYAPYSGFHVGAALLAQDGTVYTGCNIENAAYGPSNCAERTAFFTAVSQGQRAFRAIAIVGGKDGVVSQYCPPCGVCRQVMTEFCSGEFQIILGKSHGEYQILTLQQLMPYQFNQTSLQ